MDDFERLERQIRQRLRSVDEKERSQQTQLQSEMAQIEQRHIRFNAVAEALMRRIIEPRLKKLVSLFDNADLLNGPESQERHCVCCFHHSSRYPATVKLTLSVAHDAQVQRILVAYNLEILPVFFRFEGRDQMDFPLDATHEEPIIQWVEAKILAFVDTYLEIERTDQYQQGNLVTDPVCGMRFRKSVATAEVEQAGRTYFFCSDICHEKFLKEPRRYVPSRIQ